MAPPPAEFAGGLNTKVTLVLTNRVCSSWLALSLRRLRCAGGWIAALFLAACGLISLPAASAQGDAVMPDEAVTNNRTAPPKEPVESEIGFEGFDSFGNYKIFAAGHDMKIFKGSFEYDRHSWGYFIGARLDYVGEITPAIFLNQAKKVSIWGNPFIYSGRKWVYGGGIAPIGVRLLWRDHKTVKPFLIAKGGVIAFHEKTPCTQCTYEDFSLETETGFQVTVNPRFDLRMSIGDYHFSNAFLVDPNPGLDVMRAGVGISYHLDRPSPVVH